MHSAPFDDEAFSRVLATLNERQARLYAAERALVLGYGGRARIVRLSGLSYPTLQRGVTDLWFG